MRFARSLFGLGLICLGLFAAPATASADPIGPIYTGNKSCVLDISQGATWAPYTSGDLKDQSSTANTAAAPTILANP